MFLQLLINGLVTGAIYALVSSGFFLIYTCKFVHFAHGSVIALAGYFLYLFFALLGLNFWVAVILAIIFAAFFGLAVNCQPYLYFREWKNCLGE